MLQSVSLALWLIVWDFYSALNPFISYQRNDIGKHDFRDHHLTSLKPQVTFLGPHVTSLWPAWGYMQPLLISYSHGKQLKALVEPINALTDLPKAQSALPQVQSDLDEAP